MGCAGSKDEVPKAPESATTKPDRTADATEAAVQTVTCYCGAVKITVTGEPQLTPMCHCSDCRSWTGDLGQAARLYTPDQVKIDGEIFGIEFDGKYALPRAALLPGTPTASPPAPTPSRRALQSECAVARQEPIEAPQLQEVWRARRQRSRALDEHDVCARRPVQDAFQARDAPLLRRAHHGYQGRRAQVQDHAHGLWRLRRDHGGVEVRESALTRALRGVSLRVDRNTGEQFSESHPR